MRSTISGRIRAVLLRWVLAPSLIAAAAFLAFWLYRASLMLETLSERSIIASTVLLAKEKVDRVEQLIISNDNAVFNMVNADDLDPLATRWVDIAERVSPTVRSVLVLDQSMRTVRHLSRDSEAQAAQFRTVFFRFILPELHLENEPAGSHRHLHDTFDGRPYLISYLTRELAGRRHFVVLQADMDYLRTEMLHAIFDDPAERDHFNVADERGRLVLGKTLRGDFVVSRQFPTTLYKWQLSAVPQSAPELEAARSRRRRLLDGVLVSLSLAVLVAGVAFLAAAARNESRLNELKSDFIATVSHELKTPLSLIRMFSEMLATERVASEEKRRQYLDIIVRESERLTALIENVLDFAKVERGKAAYEFHRANLAEVAARGVDLFRYRLEKERPQLILDLPNEMPDSSLDDRALQLLLFNLLDNAVKYAPDGESITIRVRVVSGGRYQTLEVEDRGPGIDEDDERRIFERFYRGRSARSGGARGSGIGLALVKHIANAHGGEVSVHNATPHGAVFSVQLPLRPPPEEPLEDSSEGDGG